MTVSSGFAPLHLAQQREAVHPRHPHVGEDEVVVVRRRALERLLAVRDRAHLVAVVAQDDGEEVAHRLFVVDDEDSAEGHAAQSSTTARAA